MKDDSTFKGLSIINDVVLMIILKQHTYFLVIQGPYITINYGSRLSVTNIQYKYHVNDSIEL